MPIRIAIVDDKSQNRILLSEQLGMSMNFTIVFVAKNGIDFLEKMKQLDKKDLPQVVLMDIEMPEMDGIETVSNARLIYPGTNFLMLTVFDDDEKIFDAIKAGASGYLLKDEKIIQALAKSVQTLWAAQGKNGQIPSNVGVSADGKIAFTTD